MIEVQLKDILEKNFAGDVVEVMNESHLHAGHAGSPGTGQSHFSVLIVSHQFENLSRVNRHRAVNLHVTPLFEQGLHALNLRLFTGSEYKCSL
jgi:stress-induced morphogen